MVSIRSDVPQFVLDGDTQTFLELADPSARTRQKLTEATGDDAVRLLARSWFNQFHGSRHEGLKMFVLLMREEDIPFGPEDVQAITGRPPVRTQT
jgi:hypothetical protein